MQGAAGREQSELCKVGLRILDAEDRFLEDLFRETYRDLHLYAYAKLRDFHRAEELTQDVFVMAQSKLDELRLSPNPPGWLMNVLKNKIMHEFRTRTRKRTVPLSEVSDEAADEAAGAAYISADIEMREIFTKEEWQLIDTIYVEGRTITKAAQELGISYDACRRRMNGIREKARESLKDWL
jgi:RNA polymerase sigma-70 factor (ECF subfamily)